VATPQACWRNLYKKDFECQPMGKTGEDEYGIEVPAKSVNDGFAYYLEAYDNNDNGPARSGAPELPNAVAVEDAPPPKLSSLAVVANDQGAQQVGKPDPNAMPGSENFNEGRGPAAPQKPQESSHVLRWVMVGGAVVSAGGSLGLHFHANSLVSQLNDPNTDHVSIQNQINTEQSVSNILIGVTIAFAVGAVAFWTF
jgi:hypothetical protein